MLSNRLGMPLSARQREVVALIGEGLADKAIAHRLGLNPGTVKQYAVAIRGRLGLESKVQVAVWWTRQQEQRT